MSLYSQNVSNNPLSMDGLIVGNFDEVYVDGVPITPTDITGLVPYVGATTAVDLNSKKIMTTYVPVNDEDLTNKLYNDGRYLKISGFSVSSGGFVFDGTSTVYLHSNTKIITSTATPTYSLGLNSSGTLIQFSGGTGDAVLSAGTSLSPQIFTGYDKFNNTLKTADIDTTGNITASGLTTTNTLKILTTTTTTPLYALGILGTGDVVQFTGGTGDAILSAGTLPFPQQFTGYNFFSNLWIGACRFPFGVTSGTPTYILGVDTSTGNLVSTASTASPSQLTITNTAVAGNYYPVYITNTATGVRTVYGMNGAFYDPSTQIWEATNIKSAGTTTCVGTLFTQSGITNTAGQFLITDNLRSPNTGMTFIIPSASATFGFQNNTTELAKIDTTGITCNSYNALIDTGMNLNVSSSTATAYNISFRHNTTPFFTANRDAITITPTLFVNTIQSSASTDLNLIVPTGANFHNFLVGGNTQMCITQTGMWMPSNGGTSLYIRDTQTTATTTYGRYFGVSGTIFQDFYGTFMWRALNLAGNAGPNIMYLRSSGLNINQSSTTHPTLDAYELVVGNNSSTYQSSAKIIIRGKSNVALTGPSIDFTAWDSHTSPQASIECIDDNFWGGIINFHAKPNGAGAGGAMAQIAQFRNTGFLLKANTQSTTTDCLYTYASTDPNNLFQMCQHETVMLTYDGDWAVGRYLGIITKHHQGSKLRCVATATQYAGGAITLIFSIGLRHVSTGAWTYLIQNTFTNISYAHWVCPNIGMTYNLPAGSYEVYVYGNQFTDGNDYVRIHLTISPA